MWIEEMIFRKHSADFPRYGQSEPDKRMNENNRHQFLEIVHYLYIEGVIIWGNTFDRDTNAYPNFSITSYGEKALDANDIIPQDTTGHRHHNS